MKFNKLLVIVTAVFMLFSLAPVTAIALWVNDDGIETGVRTLQCEGDGELEVRFVSKTGKYMNFYKDGDKLLVDEVGLKDEYIKAGMSDMGDVFTVSKEVASIQYPLSILECLEITVKPAFGYTLYRFYDVTCGCYTYLENKDDKEDVFIVTPDNVEFIAAEFKEDENTNIIVEVTPVVEVTPQDISMTLNGVPIYSDVPPYIENNRTMAPVRFIGEALNADVDWNGEARLVTMNAADGTVISLTIGEANMTVTKGDDPPSTITMDVQAVIKDGRTFVPVRYVAEALGLAVDWNGGTRTVIFNSNSN